MQCSAWAELGPWWEAAWPAPEMLPAAWEGSTASLSRLNAACWLQKHQELMRRAPFPACSILPRGQAAQCVGGLHHRSTITSSPNKGRGEG